MLRLCADCDRHVRLTGPCPYCGSETMGKVPVRAGARAVRRGTFIGIAATLAAVACGSEPARIAIYGAPDTDASWPHEDKDADAAPSLPLFDGSIDSALPADATPSDAGTSDASDAEASTDAGTD